MPPPEAPEGSNNPDTLAAVAADQKCSAEDRERAFAGLHDLIRRLAISLSIRLIGLVRPEFADGAIAEIYLRMGKFTPGGPFAAWCYRTLHNWMTDELRKEAYRRRHEREAARLHPEVRSAAPSPLSLSRQELDVVATWPLGQRLALLCLTGLWRDFPEPTWRAWYTAYAPGGEPVLNSPFPPEEFERCPDSQQRADILAQLLQVRRGTLAVWVHRCASRLRELRRA